MITYLPLTYAERAISILKIYLCSPITFSKICLWAVKPQAYNSAEMWILLPNFSNISWAFSDSFHHQDVFPLGGKYHLLFERFKNWICFLVTCCRFGLQCQLYPMFYFQLFHELEKQQVVLVLKFLNKCRFLVFVFTILSDILHFISDALLCTSSVFFTVLTKLLWLILVTFQLSETFSYVIIFSLKISRIKV